MTAIRGAGLAVGQRVQVTIEKVAHGGHFIARHEGQVLFIRHGIPGEVVTVEVTSRTEKFARGDVVEVHQPDAERVTPPCAYSGAGKCGGCDFQHISAKRQRQLKSDVITEQFSRLAKMEISVEVEEVSPDLHWRTRAGLTSSANGKLGFFAHRSHNVVEISDCVILDKAAGLADLTKKLWQANSTVEISVGSDAAVTIATAPKSEKPVPAKLKSGNEFLTEVVDGRELRVHHNAFWQGNSKAPEVLSNVVREYAGVKPGDHVLDLYGGVGLFAAAILDEIGPGGRVDIFESSLWAVADAKVNFESAPNVFIHEGDVSRNISLMKRCDVVILDPPRDGAGAAVIEKIARLDARTIVYVACDPAALARDSAYLAAAGFVLQEMRAFDLFPMTHHIECVARFTK